MRRKILLITIICLVISFTGCTSQQLTNEEILERAEEIKASQQDEEATGDTESETSELSEETLKDVISKIEEGAVTDSRELIGDSNYSLEQKEVIVKALNIKLKTAVDVYKTNVKMTNEDIDRIIGVYERNYGSILRNNTEYNSLKTEVEEFRVEREAKREKLAKEYFETQIIPLVLDNVKELKQNENTKLDSYDKAIYFFNGFLEELNDEDTTILFQPYMELLNSLKATEKFNGVNEYNDFIKEYDDLNEELREELITINLEIPKEQSVQVATNVTEQPNNEMEIKKEITPTPTQKPSESVKIIDNKISKSEYDAIKEGDSYDSVVSIIGCQGELMSESSMDIGGEEYTATMYSWEGAGDIGANACILFENDKVSMKSEYGLK